MLFNNGPAGPAKGADLSRVTKQTPDRRCQSIRPPGRDQQSGPVICDNLPDRGQIRGDIGNAAGHRFQQDHPKAFFERRKNMDAQRIHENGDIDAVAEEKYFIRYPDSARGIPEELLPARCETVPSGNDKTDVRKVL